MSKSIEIKDSSKLRNILRIFSALDDARWSDTGNYNLINYCEEDFTPDEKLLTHWLCYITDRGTAFQRVWDVGGYVLSHLVRDFTKRRKTPERTVLDDHLPAQGGLRLECPLVRANPRLKFYAIDSGPVKFASRYMPADTLSIYRTLFILDRLAERSFTQFIYLVVHGETNQGIAIRKLAAAFHFLTYMDIGIVKAGEVQDRMAELKLKTGLEEQLSAFLRNSKVFVADLNSAFSTHRKKRLWCSIRDYLKSDEFNSYLVGALEQIDTDEAPRWSRKNVEKAALAMMELPGDVWNNDPIFRDGLFSPHVGSIPKSWDMPRTIRAIHTQMEGQGATFYPEQLDVTFNFVPNMCGKLQCHRCIFGGGIGKLCHQQRGFYCPVTLAACGYFFVCDPDNCAFKSDSVRGVCKARLPNTPAANARRCRIRPKPDRRFHL
ncbi:MAG: hypothetical protein ABSF10_09590 [Verrucomicrobiota bacterium]|jgi:hypothetical protein